MAAHLKDPVPASLHCEHSAAVTVSFRKAAVNDPQAHCAALGVTLQPPVCKHWRRRGACAFQARCFFRHPPEAAPKPDTVAEARDPPSKVRAAAKAAAASRSAAWRAWNLGRAATDELGRPRREAGGRAAAGPSVSLGDPAGPPAADSSGASADDARGDVSERPERPAAQGGGAGAALHGRSGASAAARGLGEQATGSGAPAGGDMPEQPVRSAARRRPRSTGCRTAGEEGPRCRIRNAFRASVFRRCARLLLARLLRMVWRAVLHTDSSCFWRGSVERLGRDSSPPLQSHNWFRHWFLLRKVSRVAYSVDWQMSKSPPGAKNAFCPSPDGLLSPIVHSLKCSAVQLKWLLDMFECSGLAARAGVLNILVNRALVRVIRREADELIGRDVLAVSC